MTRYIYIKKGEKGVIELRWFMVFNATFNNISVISWRQFIGGGNQSTREKTPTCRNSLTNFVT